MMRGSQLDLLKRILAEKQHERNAHKKANEINKSRFDYIDKYYSIPMPPN